RMGVHDHDFVKNLVSCSTHDTLLFFTNTGKVYRAKGYEIPESGRTAKGIPVINLLGIDSAETIQAFISVERKAEPGKYLFFKTL
ncbi:DNA gyrase subunit A, partial [Enterococcus faecalis]|uniref:DNA gyrase C-terminal beta-propeller domain-containing protein n=1 Tax=Enterococcus faecalis TaxID=1351 RepID=UPI002958988C